MQNGDGHGTDEARRYEVFLNGESVVLEHRSGNSKAPVKVAGRNTLKVVLTGESYRKVLVENPVRRKPLGVTTFGLMSRTGIITSYLKVRRSVGPNNSPSPRATLSTAELPEHDPKGTHP